MNTYFKCFHKLENRLIHVLIYMLVALIFLFLYHFELIDNELIYFFKPELKTASSVSFMSLPWISDQTLAEYTNKVFSYLIHNSIACLIIILTGLIPFLFVPSLIIIFNGLLMSSTINAITLIGTDIGFIALFKLFFFHLIPEILAFSIAAGLGSTICIFINRKIISSEDKCLDTTSTKSWAYFTKNFLIIFFLLTLAALIESL